MSQVPLWCWTEGNKGVTLPWSWQRQIRRLTITVLLHLLHQRMAQKARGKLQSSLGIKKTLSGHYMLSATNCKGMPTELPVLLAKLFLCLPPSLTHTQPLPLVSLLPPAITQLHSTHILACQGHSSQTSLGQTQSANLSSSNFNTHPELTTFYHSANTALVYVISLT